LALLIFDKKLTISNCW